MRFGLAHAPMAMLSALLLAGCVSAAPSSSDYLAERDAARRYLVSDVSKSAAAEAMEEIRQAASGQERAQLDAYLADPAHARQLPAKYQDYLIEVFDAGEIDAMAASTGEGAAFRQQVDVHRFVLAQSLVEWHIGKADLEGSAVFGDPLVTVLIAQVRATPDPLIPQSRQR